MLIIPRSFEQLVHSFYYDSDREVGSLNEWVDRAIGGLFREEQLEVKRFPMSLFAREPTPEELVRIWESASPLYRFEAPSIRRLLSLVRDRIPH
jgi:hypothetical protein